MGDDPQTNFGVISIDEFLENSTLVKYVYDQVTLSEWQVNSLSASFHLSVGLKGTSVQSYDDDVSDNRDVVFFVNGSSYFQGNCKINDNLVITKNLNVNGITVFDNDLTVKNMMITNNLNVSNDVFLNSNMSVKGIVDITSKLIVNDDALFYSNMDICGNTSIGSKLYVNDNVLLDSNVSINGITDISNSLIVKGPVSFNSSLSVIDKSFFRDDVIIYTNLSIPTLYVSDRAIIHNLSVIDNASINTLNVNKNTSLNSLFSNNTSTNTLYVDSNASFNDGFYIKETAVINNLSVPNITKLNTLNVSGTTTLINANVNNLLNVHYLNVSESTTLNTLNISGAVLALNKLSFRDKVYIGGKDLENSTIPEATLDVNKVAYISTLYSDKIICNDIKANLTSKEIVFLGITKMSILNNVDISNGITRQIYAQYIFGEEISTILSNTFTYGIFSHGISVFDPTYTDYSYFDLSANSQSVGIKYNGPINIGEIFPNTFNLKASGLIQYDGSMNIGQTTLTDFNLNGVGVINYDGSMNIGQTTTTEFNLKGNGVINYDGSMNIGQNTLSEFNLNASGIMKYDGIINIGSNTETYLDISANSMNGGINYNGPVNINSNDLNIVGSGMISYNGIIDMNGPIYIDHDGDTSLDVIGNTKITGNLLLGGNITSYSDIRIKDNICNLSSCLSKIQNISGYSFTRKDLPDKEKIYIGLLAQEVEEYFPHLVTETNDIKSINYQSMVAVLLECVKELKGEINELKGKIKY
jgi:hypothetical protein